MSTLVNSRTGRPTSAVCAVCGAVFPVDPRGKFPRCCSQACRVKDAARRRRENAGKTDGPGEQLTCRRCGQPFRWVRPATGNQTPPTYCTPRCATRAAAEADPAAFRAYNAAYYQDNKERILARQNSRKSARQKSTRRLKSDAEKREALRKYQHDYYLRVTKLKRRKADDHS